MSANDRAVDELHAVGGLFRKGFKDPHPDPGLGPAVEAVIDGGVTEQTYYRWRKQYGDMGTDQLKELKRLQKENERLRKALSDLTLDELILTEAAKGNF